MTIKEPLMDLAKKSANFKLLKRNQTHIQRAQNRFIEKILWPSSQNDLIQKIDKISDLEKAQKSVSKDFLNPKKINMVVMIPKDTLTKVQTLKGLLSHGFKLLK